MTYCTLNPDGTITPAPRTLPGVGCVHYNPSASMYEAAGYLPIVHTDPPEVGENETVSYISRFEEQDGRAVQLWEAAEPPEPAAPTLDDRVANLEQTVDTMLTGGGT